MNKFWDVPPLWKGKRAFIIGGGPSLLNQDISLIKNERIIGVNQAFRLGQFVDICFYGDKAFYMLNEAELFKYGGIIVSCAPSHPDKMINRVKWLRRSKQGGMETAKRNAVAWNNNSGFAAINLAYHLGVSEVILLGFDMTSGDDGKTHWHNYYKKPNPLREKNPPYAKFLKYQHIVSKEAERVNLKVKNATPEGNLTAFERVQYEGLF